MTKGEPEPPAIAEGGDLFDNDLDEEISVFKSAGGDSDLVKENQNNILFFIDLENETIVEKEGDQEQNLEEELQGGMHPVLINQYPLCKNHSIFLMFAHEGLP
jgi:hypothetical protein